MRYFDLDTIKGNECPDCDGFLIRTSLPREQAKYKCIKCGMITWLMPEVQGHTGKPMRIISVQIFQDYTEAES